MPSPTSTRLRPKPTEVAYLPSGWRSWGTGPARRCASTLGPRAFTRHPGVWFSLAHSHVTRMETTLGLVSRMPFNEPSLPGVGRKPLSHERIAILRYKICDPLKYKLRRAVFTCRNSALKMNVHQHISKPSWPITAAARVARPAQAGKVCVARFGRALRGMWTASNPNAKPLEVSG
jgi:hypothetical protein